jgi:hypothetical protein
MRAIDIAANGHMSKQAVKPLIDHLEARGYLERVRSEMADTLLAPNEDRSPRKVFAGRSLGETAIS